MISENSMVSTVGKKYSNKESFATQTCKYCRYLTHLNKIIVYLLGVSVHKCENVTDYLKFFKVVCKS